MTTLTLAVPDEMKKKMDSFPEMNWSEVARQAFLNKMDDMEFLRKEFTEKSLENRRSIQKKFLRTNQK